MPLDYDIIIAGGGMVGASLACALRKQDIRIAVIESVSPKASVQPSYDDRGLALSLATQRILAGLGLWQGVSESANPIQHVHVSDQDHFGCVRLHAEMLQVSALGYVVIARELGHALMDTMAKSEIVDVFCPATVRGIEVGSDHAEITVNMDGQNNILRTKLFVAADGTHSQSRDLLGIKTQTKDYGQTAIVTNVTPAQPHRNTAYERFTRSGPLALLPLTGQRCVVVFTVNTDDLQQYMQMGDAAFINVLQARFGRRLGKFERLGARKSYPIMQLNVCDPVQERAIVLGNSAHTLHPNGAQGFNLGLRDAAGLAEILIPAFRDGKDPGKRQLLESYMQLREHDQQRVMQFSDGLASLFYNDLPHKVMARNMGMLLTEMVPLLKRSFMRRTMGLHGKQPGLVRGIY